MRKLAAAVAVASLAASSLLAGCVGCGAADDYAKGTDGQWLLTRMFTYESPCPAFDQPEQLAITIANGLVTVDSPDITLETGTVHVDGDRQLVELTVHERWYTDESPTGYVDAPVTYSLELVPISARLEGSVDVSFPFDTPTSGTTCASQGSASAGRVGG